MCRRPSRPRPRVSSPPSPSSSWVAAWSITGEGGEGGEREKGSESESWHAQPGVVTSAVLGRICKNEPLLHLLEVSLLHAL